MSSVTLAESAKLAQNDLVAGVIENVLTVNPIFELLPFDGIDGNALAYNRENVIGGAGVAGVGTAVTAAVDVIAGGNTAKNPASFTLVTSMLTTILGDAEMNGLIQATRSDDGNDQLAVQIASKAKSVGRQYQQMLVTGTGGANQFLGLVNLVPAGQMPDTGVNGSALSFALLDELLDLITDKESSPDFIMMNSRTHRSFKALLRALGGATINETIKLPSGKEVLQYCGVPVFRNDWIPINVAKGGSANTGYVIAGTFDDGSRTHGVAGLTAKNAAGIQVVRVGEKEDADESITRVKWYAGLALFSQRGISMLDGITN